MYVNQQWRVIPSRLRFAKLTCFYNRFQEPCVTGAEVTRRYVMVRYTNSTILFDERFVDYGCNKVQYIDYLRNMGYRFYILTQAFAMDVAHHECIWVGGLIASSKLRRKYMGDIRTVEKPLMQLACYEFMSKLDTLYEDVNKMGICYKNQRVIYSFPHIASWSVCWKNHSRQ